MAQDHEELSKRPDRVIILDADDPMTEVHGRFVWLDDHERVLNEVRREAFDDGYRAGLHEAQALVVGRRSGRRGLLGYARLGLLILLLLLVLLMLPIVLS